MTDLDFSAAPFPVRPDIAAAHARFFARLAEPGSWWTGAERVAIAAAVREAADCALCDARAEALSPESVPGEHDGGGGLSPAAVDVVHRIVRDNARLSRAWLDKRLAEGLSDGHYVEIVGLVVATLSIDELCRGLGLSPHPLPEPRPGAPSHYRPGDLDRDTAWVPMLKPGGAVGREADLWSGPRTGNVIRAMSLVPDAVRDLASLSAAHYLSMEEVPNLAGETGRALDRLQIELIAGRVSALNECFY